TTALGVEIATRDRVPNVRSSPLPPDAWDRMERQAADPGTEFDDTPEDAELSDGEFLLQLHAGRRAGLVAAGRDVHPAPKDRPWSSKRKRRDRYGRAFGGRKQVLTLAAE